MTEEHEENRLPVQPLPSALARGLAGVGMSVAGIRWGPAGAAAVAGLLPYMEQLAARVEAELRGKGELVGDAALAAARDVRPEITDVELWGELVDDPELLALTMRVMDAAKYTAWPGKLRWLGEVLSRVAVEKERLSEHQVLVAALSDLDPPHALVLATLGEPSPHELRAQQPRAWLLSELVNRLPLDDGVIRACCGTLARHGLARDTRGPFSTEAYDVTALGRAMLAVMGARPSHSSGSGGEEQGADPGRSTSPRVPGS
jgi:hypothetical protein